MDTRGCGRYRSGRKWGRLCLGENDLAGIEADQAYDDRKLNRKRHLRLSYLPGPPEVGGEGKLIPEDRVVSNGNRDSAVAAVCGQWVRFVGGDDGL